MNRLLLPLVLLTLATPGVARADTLHRSGPAEERLDLVILGDGFRVEEQARFDEAARRLWEGLRATEPFSLYTGLLNVHTGFRASAESGTGPNTAYGSRFAASTGTALLADRTALLLGDAVRAGGGEADRVIVIVNSGRHGGATVGGTVAYVTTSPDWISTAMHELGHLIGKVGDEYEHVEQRLRLTALAGGDEAAARRLITDRYANLTLASTREALPWREWVQPSTNVPARSLSDGVSAWEGGGYFERGIYRPQRSCRMRTNWLPFCEVCREQVVLRLHELASPVRLEVTDQGGARRVRLVTALPADRWAVRWGGVAASGLSALVPAGTSASVIVEDATPWVLGDRREGLRYRFVVPASGASGPVSSGGATSAPPAGWPRAGVVSGLTTRLRVRASASTQAAILGHLNPGDTVQVTGPAVDGFYPITFAGGRGYVSVDYVRLSTPPATTGIAGAVGS